MKTLVICICTYKRNKSLIDCLKSLEKLNTVKNIKVEVLIIDNTINNNSFNVIKNIKKKYKYNITFINEKKRGVVYARNKCLNNLKVLNPNYASFIDDDCIVDPYWLTNILKLLKSNNVDIITGPQLHKDRLNMDYNKINFTKYFEKKYVKDSKSVDWAATNNVFFKYSVIKNKKLLFDTKLNKFGMGEDQLFFLNLSKRA